MKKETKYKIMANSSEFVKKYRPELSGIQKMELESMLNEFAIDQVLLFSKN